MYLAFGACHFPYHVPKAYMTPYSGRYDRGWGAIRRERFARQNEVGILHHTDDQLQRLVDFLEFSGELDNTILIVMSDNGAGQ